MREDVLLHVLVERLAHLVQVSLVLGRDLLDWDDLCGGRVKFGSRTAP